VSHRPRPSYEKRIPHFQQYLTWEKRPAMKYPHCGHRQLNIPTNRQAAMQSIQMAITHSGMLCFGSNPLSIAMSHIVANVVIASLRCRRRFVKAA
jgi:hypothetical protein